MKKNINKHYRLDEKLSEMLRERAKEMKISESEYVRRLIIADFCPLKPMMIHALLSQICENMNMVTNIHNRWRSEGKEYGECEEDLLLLRRKMAMAKEYVLDLKRLAERGDT